MLNLDSKKTQKTVVTGLLMIIVIVGQQIAAKYGIDIPQEWVTLVLAGLGLTGTANIVMHGLTDSTAMKAGLTGQPPPPAAPKPKPKK